MAIALASYQAFLDVRGRILLPKEVVQNQVDLISDVQEIKTPFLFRAFNPGAIRDQDGYLLIARCDRYGIKSVLAKWMGETRRPKLFAFSLDHEFQVVSKPSQISIAKGVKDLVLDPNDPRVVNLDGRIFIVYNDMLIENGVRIGDRFMYVAEVVKKDAGYEMVSTVRLQYDNSIEFYKTGVNKPFCEKNWIPFVQDQELYFVYMIDPLIVLKADLTTGVCHEVKKSEAVGFSKFGFPRGGTPLVEENGHLIGMYHIRIEDRDVGFFKEGGYYFGALEINPHDSFQIEGATDAILTGKGLYQGRKKIVYPTGIVDKDSDWVLFWGEEDRKMCVGKIPKAKLKEYIKAIK